MFTRFFLILLCIISVFSYAKEFQFSFSNEDKGDGLTNISNSIFPDGKKSDGNLSQSIYLGYSDNISNNTKFILSIQNDIFTPSHENKLEEKAVVGDRPFASSSTINFDISNKYKVYDLNMLYLDQIFTPFIKFGLVGNKSHGDSLQNFTHKLIGADEYKGWSYQLQNKYAFIYGIDYMPRLSFGLKQFALSLEPNVIYSGGNIFEYCGYGGFIRIGSIAKYDYGSRRINPLNTNNILNDYKENIKYVWNIYSGYQKRYMNRNYFLEGKTSKTGIQTVNMLDKVTDKVIGINFLFVKMLLDVSITERSKEFTTQKHSQTFVKAGLSYIF